MKLKACVFAAAVCAVLAVPSVARASTIVFNLDCTMTASACPVGGGPFGAITMTDVGNNIDFIVALSDPTLTVRLVNLDWNALIGGALPTTGWATSGGNLGSVSVLVGTNAVGAFQYFDIAVPDTAAPFFNPLTFTLSRTGT